MLGKLVKYELKATARKLAPLYVALLVFALIINLFIGKLGFENSMSGGILQAIMLFAYGVTMAAVFIITLYITLQRFNKNLLGREGYLMNTLPVPTWMNISSKLIVSLIWSIVSGIMAILSIIIISFSEDLFLNLADIMIYLKFNFQGQFLHILEWIIYLFASMVGSTLIIYLSISLGHLANKRRVLLSFGAYMLINMVVSFVKGLLNLSIYVPNTMTLTPNIHGLLIFDILLSVALFMGCNYIIKNKLNLE